MPGTVVCILLYCTRGDDGRRDRRFGVDKVDDEGDDDDDDVDDDIKKIYTPSGPVLWHDTSVIVSVNTFPSLSSWHFFLGV